MRLATARHAAAAALLLPLLALAACGGDDDDDNPTGVTGRQCRAQDATDVVGVGQSISGSLANGDCLAPDGTLVDYYRLTITTTRSVTITMRSDRIDSYLLLLNGTTGGQINADDDSGGGSTGFDARITTTLQPGTYVIGANSVSPETGPYTLQVQ